MDSRRPLVALSVNTLLLVLLFQGCFDYESDDASTADGSTTGGTGGAGGSSAQSGTGGAGGSSAQSGTGGAGGSSAQSGTGGASGSGDSGTDTGGASCTEVMPCGGDVVGTWTAAPCRLTVTGNADLSGFGLDCTSAPVTGSLRVTGTWTASSDGKYTDNTTTSGDAQLELPPECLRVSGTTTTCERLGGSLQALGYASLTCTDNSASGGCTCSATVQQAGGLALVSIDASTTGTYTTSNNNLVTTAFGNRHGVLVLRLGKHDDHDPPNREQSRHGDGHDRASEVMVRNHDCSAAQGPLFGERPKTTRDRAMTQ